ncbi:MAG: YceI family protein [Bacteroidales bacterium]
MIHRKSLIGLWILCFLGNSFALGSEITRLWNVTSKSSLEIQGTTNVNSFGCLSVYENSADMIHERWDPCSEKWEIFGSIYLGVAQFDCNNRIMNNDFRNTLNYERYPEIKVEFLNLKEVVSRGRQRKAEGWVEVTMAGSVHRYFIQSDLFFIDDRYSVLRGSHVFKFSDFGLVPPQKGFGMVRVNDEITVSFELIMEQVAFSEN